MQSITLCRPIYDEQFTSVCQYFRIKHGDLATNKMYFDDQSAITGKVYFNEHDALYGILYCFNHMQKQLKQTFSKLYVSVDGVDSDDICEILQTVLVSDDYIVFDKLYLMYIPLACKPRLTNLIECITLYAKPLKRLGYMEAHLFVLIECILIGALQIKNFNEDHSEEIKFYACLSKKFSHFLKINRALPIELRMLMANLAYDSTRYLIRIAPLNVQVALVKRIFFDGE